MSFNTFSAGNEIKASEVNNNFNELYETTKSILFGDGSDGSATISSDTTLTEDKCYTDLTIQSGVNLDANGYRIFATGTITNNGTIKVSFGTSAGSVRGGAAGGSGGGTAGVVGGDGGRPLIIVANTIDNGNGTITAPGEDGNDGGGGWSSTGNGSDGGDIDCGYGGNGGDSNGTAAAVAYGGIVTISNQPMEIPSLGIGNYDAGLQKSIGGGGGGAGSGNSFDGSDGSGGGGGGFVLIYYISATWGIEQAPGGIGGSGDGIGSAGNDGTNGMVKKIQI